jgi:hypothetical protein
MALLSCIENRLGIIPATEVHEILHDVELEMQPGSACAYIIAVHGWLHK